MKNDARCFSILALALGLAMPVAYAHDPKEHAKEAAAAKAGPDCAAIKEMDQSNMDPNDPVMKAMLTKCGAATDRGGMDHSQMQPPADTAADLHERAGR